MGATYEQRRVLGSKETNAKRKGEPGMSAGEPRKEPAQTGNELEPCLRDGMNGGEILDDSTTRFSYRIKYGPRQ